MNPLRGLLQAPENEPQVTGARPYHWLSKK